MNPPRYSQLAARLLRTGHPQATPEPGAKERGVATLEAAMKRRGRTVSRRAWAIGLGAATAAAVLLWFVLPSAEPEIAALRVTGAAEGTAWVVTGAHRVALGDFALLPNGASVSTADTGAANLRLSTGTRLALGGDSELALAQSLAEQHFVLARGRLVADVEHLEAGQRFVLSTPDTDVEVVGTRFEVRVLDASHGCGEGIRTRLEVREGAVLVRARAGTWQVEQGEHWPPDCARPSLESPAPSVPPSAPSATPSPSPSADERSAARPRGRHGAQATPSRAPPKLAEGERSTLDRQSDLFARAVAASRAGRSARALQLYAELLARFPNSALAENAIVGRMRLLSRVSPGRARREAARYLDRHPSGFARAEAERLLEAP